MDAFDGIELDDLQPAAQEPEGKPSPAPAASEPAAPGEAKPATPPAHTEDIAEIKGTLKSFVREIERLREENRQLAESERMWQERAARTAPADKPAAPKKELLDDIAERGAVALKDHGYVTDAELEARIEARAREIATEVAAGVVNTATRVSDFTREFPELKDPESEFSREVKRHYEEAVRIAPELRGKESAWILAVDRAKVERAARVSAGQPPVAKPDDRQQRIQRQGGDGLGRTNTSEDGAPRLTEQQREIAKRMNMSEKDYLATKAQLSGARK